MRGIREILRLLLRIINSWFISENLFLTYSDPPCRFIAIAELSKINLFVYYKVLCQLLPSFHYLHLLHPLHPLHLIHTSSTSIPYTGSLSTPTICISLLVPILQFFRRFWPPSQHGKVSYIMISLSVGISDSQTHSDLLHRFHLFSQGRHTIPNHLWRSRWRV